MPVGLNSPSPTNLGRSEISNLAPIHLSKAQSKFMPKPLIMKKVLQASCIAPKLQEWRNILASVVILSGILTQSYAGPGDTTIVQAFTYGSPQNAKFLFPPETKSYEKILMYYNLKCNPNQNPSYAVLTFLHFLQKSCTSISFHYWQHNLKFEVQK